MPSGYPRIVVEPGCALARLERRSRGRDLQIRALCACETATEYAANADAAIRLWRAHAKRHARG